MRRYLIAILAPAFLALAVFGASQASAAEMFGQQVTPGSTIGSVQAADAIRLEDVSVTSTSGGGVTAAATLYAGTSTTPVTVSITYRDSDNWTIDVVRNGAGSSYAPASPTSLDINDVDGTIARTNGVMSYQLILHGYVLGDATFDMTAYIDATGWVATSVVEDLEIGGMTLTHASVEVSTIDAFAELTASLETDGGNFDVDIKATKPGNATPDQYTLSIDFTGAELKGASTSFTVNSFAFHYDVTTPSSGCTTIDSQATMSITMGSTTYALDDVHVIVTCSTLTTFEFSVTVSHEQKWNNVTKSGTLSVAWYGTPGTFRPQFAKPIGYQQGFFGSVDLSATRHFSRKYQGRHFRRDVTIGIGFAATVYQPSPGAAFTGGAGAGGAFDANRVSGGIGCGVLGDDFRCSGRLRLNPKWAGVYHHTWDDL